MTPYIHSCPPGQFCGVCEVNVRRGGRANHPSNLVRPMKTTPTPSPQEISRCVNLGDELKSGIRTWWKCKAGYGSTVRVEDPRHGHVTTRCTQLAGQSALWMIGDQCGPTCNGYQTPLIELGTMGEVSLSTQRRREWAAKRAQITWAYGVTTIPSRRKTFLPRTLASLKRAGFENPHLFIDGDSDGRSWENEFNLYVTARGGAAPVRAFGNWVAGLWELWAKYPWASRYAMFQDDVIMSKNAREFLEFSPYPDKGYLNLYSFPQYETLGGSGWVRSTQNGLGAVALVFNREAAAQVLASRFMIDRPLDRERGHKFIDGGIVTALKKVGWSEYFHMPSLTQHIGDVSSIGHMRHPDSTTFRGEDFDLLSLLPGGV